MEEVKFIATAGRLVVKKIKDENESSGGIILAQPVNSNIHMGEIVSVGEQLKDEPQKFELGQIVVWQNYSGVEYTDKNEEFLILNQKDIIAIKA